MGHELFLCRLKYYQEFAFCAREVSGRCQERSVLLLSHPFHIPSKMELFFLEENQVITSRKNDCNMRKQNSRSKPWAFLFLCYTEPKLLLAGDSGSKK